MAEKLIPAFGAVVIGYTMPVRMLEPVYGIIVHALITYLVFQMGAISQERRERDAYFFCGLCSGIILGAVLMIMSYAPSSSTLLIKLAGVAMFAVGAAIAFVSLFCLFLLACCESTASNAPPVTE